MTDYTLTFAQARDAMWKGQYVTCENWPEAHILYIELAYEKPENGPEPFCYNIVRGEFIGSGDVPAKDKAALWKVAQR